MKKNLTIFIACVFLLSAVAVNVDTGHAALDNIHVGDTIYYKVSKYNVNLGDLVNQQNLPIDLSQVVLDLSGSTIGLKVMNENSATGYYGLNSFVILGKSIVIPLPSDAPASVTSVFGNQITIPSGVGLSLGVEIPGSNFVSYLGSNPSANGPVGLPIYIEPTRTAEYKALVDNISSQFPSSVSTNVTDGSSTFSVGLTYTNGTQSVSVTASWFKTGTEAGIFKSLSTSATVKNYNGTLINLGIDFSFDHLENQPLPSNIAVGQSTTLSVEKAGFDLTHTGTLFSQVNDTAVNTLKSDVAKYNGQQLIRYTITDVQGLYYQTDIAVKDINQNVFNDAGKYWFNGFTGQFTTYDPTCMSGSTPCSAVDLPPFAFVPLGAPGITPDWTVWTANFKTLSSLSNIVVSTLTSGSSKASLTNLGVTINKLTETTQLRQSGNFKYFYTQSDSNLTYASSSATAQNRPSYFTGDETGSLAVSSDLWSSYDNTGVSAGYGLTLNVSLVLNNIPVSATNSTKLSGTLDAGFVLKIKNDAFTSLPDGAKASPIGGGGIIPGISPGFEAAPALLVLIAIPIVMKKRKQK